MLGKLLKYELRSTARIMVPLYLAVLLFALINKITLFMLNDMEILVLPRIILIGMYFFLIIAVFIMTIVLTLQRFYKNLLGEEGYLMFTLPVKTHEHMLSKLITSMIWFISSSVVSILSVFILIPEYGWIKEAPEIISQLSAEFDKFSDVGLGAYVAIAIAIIFFAVINFILTVYTSMSIGHLAKKNRVLCSFGAYIGIYIVVQSINAVAITSLFSQVMFPTGDIETLMNSTMRTAPFMLLVYVLVVTIVTSVIYFVVTRLILNKKLNLE